jgi:C4-dicarboxylate-specific signal transduction histidine kinase
VQVQQVIGNLILNAVDAMEAVPAADRRLSLLTRRDGQRVSLSVRDRGVGLPADHPERCSMRSGPPSHTGWGWASA